MIARALERAARELGAATPTPRLDAEVLLAHVLGIERGRLAALDARALTAEERSAYAALIGRRAAGEPVAYLTGTREFWTLTLSVGPEVLVPRPETELLVELGLAHLKGRRAPRVLDLGTGSGALGLALAAERPDAAVDLVDASAAALAMAERNRAALGLGNVRLERGEWFAPLAGRRYDLIVSNPPYVAARDPRLELLRHEPPLALVAGPTGLEALRAIVAGASAHLVPGGRLLLEHGDDQGEAVRRLLRAAGFGAIESRADLAGHERATGGTRGD